MTRKIDRPAPAQVRQVLAELTAQTAGRPPSVVALAHRLGLSNTTFWRYYPDIAGGVAAARRTAVASTQATERRRDELQAHNAELRRKVQDLTTQLDLAIANIQRLSIDNHRLREELETATNITRIPTRRPAESNPV